MPFFRSKEERILILQERQAAVAEHEKKLAAIRETLPKKEEKKRVRKESRPDIVEEQPENYYTTEECPQAVSDMKSIKKNPENYLEINVIKTSRVVDTFAVPIDRKEIMYKNKKYHINEKFIYLLPTKAGYIMPTSFYKQGRDQPVGFLNTNKGITGKALSLLYMEQLYMMLLYSDDEKYNLFIVILLIACLAAFAVGCYFVFFHQGGLFGPPYPYVPYYPSNYTGV